MDMSFMQGLMQNPSLMGAESGYSNAFGGSSGSSGASSSHEESFSSLKDRILKDAKEGDWGDASNALLGVSGDSESTISPP